MICLRLSLLEKSGAKRHVFLELVLFLNSCACPTAKSKTPPTETYLHQINSSEHGSPPSRTTRDRVLVSALEARVEPGVRTRDL